MPLICFMGDEHDSAPSGAERKLTVNPVALIDDGSRDLGDYHHPAFGMRIEHLVKSVYDLILQPGMHAVDGGANIGHHTFPMAAAVGPTGRVIAVEAVPSCIESLRSTIRLHSRFEASVEVLHAAVTETDGEVEFLVVNEESGWSGLKPTPWTPGHLQRTSIKVQGLTLRSIVARMGGRVDFIKLDLEGSDFPALRGSRAMFDSARPVITFENGGAGSAALYGYGYDELTQFFNSIGYEVFTINGERMSPAVWARIGVDALPEAFAAPAGSAVLDRILGCMPAFITSALQAHP